MEKENSKFEMPVVEVIFFENEDVITSSAPETPIDPVNL